MARKLPQTKSELDSVLMDIWALPVHFNKAYELYALGKDRELMEFLDWVGGIPKPAQIEERQPHPFDMDENPYVDENGNWIDSDNGGHDVY